MTVPPLSNRLAERAGEAFRGDNAHSIKVVAYLEPGVLLIEVQGERAFGQFKPTLAPAPVPAVREREQALERAVSTVIGDMPFLWLAIGDDPRPGSLRRYIERNAITLLSNHGKQPIDPPSHSWLGHHCDREKVRASGLWNSNHVEEPYDPAFLDTLAGPNQAS